MEGLVLQVDVNPFSWRKLLGLWVVLAVVQVILLGNGAWLDTQAWRAMRWFFGDQGAYSFTQYSATAATRKAEGEQMFYEHEDPPMRGKLWKRTENWWPVWKTAGEPLFVWIVAAGLFFFDKRRKWYSAWTLIAVTGIVAGLGWLTRAVAGRFRPISTDGANVWELMRGFDLERNGNLSWPSGHAAAAFATAAVMTYFFPKWKWFFLVIAAMCAWSRVVNMAHFYSDAIFGAVLGWTLAGMLTVWSYPKLERHGEGGWKAVIFGLKASEA